MERTLTWEPGGLDSGAMLALTRYDPREVTLPLFSFFSLKKVVVAFYICLATLGLSCSTHDLSL